MYLSAEYSVPLLRSNLRLALPAFAHTCRLPLAVTQILRSQQLYSCPHSIPRCRRWRPWPRFVGCKGDHARVSSVRSVQAAKASSEVVVPKADSLAGAGVSLDRLDRLLHKHRYQKFFWCFVASVDSFRVVVCRHVSTGAGSVLDTISSPTSVGIPSGNARSSANAVAL